MCFCCILVYNSALVVTGDPSEMSLVITFGRLMLLLSLLYCQHANTMNCDYPDEKPCLNVFDSEPQGNPKCYCTNLCPISLEELKKNCTSGMCPIWNTFLQDWENLNFIALFDIGRILVWNFTHFMSRASVEFKYPDSCREHFIHLLCLRPTATRRMQRLFAMC